MEVGIFSRTYETGDLQDTFRRMTTQGMTHTQFNLSNAGLPTMPEKIAEEDLIRIRECADAFGVSMVAMTGTFNMIDPDEEERRRGARQFALQCRVAKELKIPVVTLCTGSKNKESKWKWHEDNLKASAWDDLLRTTESILQYAEENNIVLGVEPEASNIINSASRARKYLDIFDTPRLKIVMDAANLFHPEEVAEMEKMLFEAFDILEKDIVLAHAKDFSFAGDIAFTAPGKGALDFSLYLRLLKKTGYKGALIMHGLTEGEASESKAYLEKVIKDENI